MTVLAFKMSRYANGVSALHGRITRKSWQVLWPHHREDEVPVGHITNGVHVRTWLAPAMQELYAKHMGADWRDHLADPRMWARIDNVPDAELWETHRVLKAALVRFVRRRGEPSSAGATTIREELVAAAQDALDPEALTIGFARRFATYKRASLIFQDMARLKRLLTNPSGRCSSCSRARPTRPIARARRCCARCTRPRSTPSCKNRVVFIEDYDINVGRHLVQGVDVWLNNPRRPQEASGTSGQKVLLNGGLNFSVLDGWWAEAYDGLNGFAIGDGITHVNVEEQDRRDAELALRHAREHDRPALLRARRPRRAARLGRADEAHDPHAGLALQHRPHGDRLREQLLPAGGGREEQPHAVVRPGVTSVTSRRSSQPPSAPRRWLGA